MADGDEGIQRPGRKFDMDQAVRDAEYLARAIVDSVCEDDKPNEPGSESLALILSTSQEILSHLPGPDDTLSAEDEAKILELLTKLTVLVQLLSSYAGQAMKALRETGASIQIEGGALPPDFLRPDFLPPTE